MNEYDLSILIPARNEMFLARTVEDLIQNKRGKTQILVGLDGAWADPPVLQHEDVVVLYYPKSIGQRAMTNQLARLSNAKWVAKTDAHCAFDEGFDVKLMDAIKGHDDWTVAPIMKNLHAFDWVCPKCGSRWYQGKTPTECLVATDMPKREKTRPNPDCDNKGGFYRDITWKPNPSPNSTSYRFDNTLHFQYFNEYTKRDEYKKQQETGITESMSLQGSFFMMTRAKYWELDICDEKHGSWGQQGVEVACKTWLSGGKVKIVHSTWYAHLFRTQGGDFGFPYQNKSVEQARAYSRELWLNNKWDRAIYPLQWLLDKFDPVPGWDVSKGVLYYSDGNPAPNILDQVQQQIRKATKTGTKIISVTLKDMSGFGDNYWLHMERGYLTMAKQILFGLEKLDTDVVFFCEHDVLYHPSHFDFVPPDKNKIYYNTNVWRVRYDDGFAVRTDDTRQLSGLCAFRDVLVEHFRKRVELLEGAEKRLNTEDFNRYVRQMGFEPGTHNREQRVDDLKSDRWESQNPNVDIRHNETLTPSRWSPDKFVNKRYTKGWKETYEIPGWGKFDEFFIK